MIDEYKQRHEQYLRKLLDGLNVPAPQIYEALYYSLFPGGKRIRPVLVYLLGELLEVNLSILDPMAAAIELTHSYSLIHDDLPAMDNDDLRRGKLSCHKAFDEATAILVGDGLQVLAIDVLFKQLSPCLPASQVLAVTNELIKASGLSGMISGQALDLSELRPSRISKAKLYTIHQLKTGKLISACLEMVLAASPSVAENHRSTLRAYIQRLGLVFQMQDDYLDYYAPKDYLGKARSSDAANHKITFAALYSQNELEEKIQHHYQIALKALESFGKKSEALMEVTQQLQARSCLSLDHS